ncbi:peptidase C39 family protein [soil metagenome]
MTYRGVVRLPLQHVLVGTLCAALGSCYVASVTSAPASAAPVVASKRSEQRQIHYQQWDSGPELRGGTTRGLVVKRGRLRIAAPVAHRTVAGTPYEQATWDSPWVEPGFSFTELIASWSALTPGNTFVEIRVRGRNDAGRTSSYDLLARWTSRDAYLKRVTDSGQADDLASVNVDTWRTPAGLTSYQLRVTLARKAGTSLNPSVDTVGAVASRLPDAPSPVSKPGVGRGVVLDVPRYSQMVHEGDYPQWNGGGEAWCSPTSTSMVLGYYDRLPPASAYSWVPAGHVDPWVDYAARSTFDYDYDGTGNWPFNTAYAAPRVGKAFVTRLRSLHEAERFIAAGIPLVASISFGSGELAGAPISSTAGHLIVIVGFTQDGDVVVNDPASKTRQGVRRTYDRAQLERAWLGGSGGTVYVLRDGAHPLPAGRQTNW